MKVFRRDAAGISGRGVEPPEKCSSCGLCASIAHAFLLRIKLPQSVDSVAMGFPNDLI